MPVQTTKIREVCVLETKLKHFHIVEDFKTAALPASHLLEAKTLVTHAYSVFISTTMKSN